MNFILATTIFMSLCCQSIGFVPTTPVCETSGCKNVEFASRHRPIDLRVNKTLTRTRVHSLGRSKIKVTTILTSREMSYCSEHLIAKNEGCFNYANTSYLTYSDTQIKEMALSHKCLVGRVCTFEGAECTGSAASACGDIVSLDRTISESDSKPNYNVPWKNILHETCLQHWTCTIVDSEYPVETQLNNGVRKYHLTLNREPIELDMHKETISTIHHFLVYIAPIMEHGYDTKMECLFDSNTKVCIATEDTEDFKKGKTFFLDSENMHYGDGFFVKVFDSPNLESDDEFSKYLSNVKTNVSASLSDLSKMSTMLLYSDLQARFNTIQLADAVDSVRDFTLKMVTAAAKTNPLFLAALLDIPGINFWITKNSSILCPCLDIKQSAKTNCIGKYIYKEGAFWVKGDKDICLKEDPGRDKMTVALNDIRMDLSLEGLSLEEFDGVNVESVQGDSILPGSRDSPTGTVFVPSIGFMDVVHGIIEPFKAYSWIASYVSLYLVVKILLGNRPNGIV